MNEAGDFSFDSPCDWLPYERRALGSDSVLFDDNYLRADRRAAEVVGGGSPTLLRPPGDSFPWHEIDGRLTDVFFSLGIEISDEHARCCEPGGPLHVGDVPPG